MADGIAGDRLPDSYVHEPRGYALSGRIMLSAIVILFAVVVIMVCLHVYARWYIIRARRRQIRRARRRTHVVFYLEPENSSNVVPLQTTHGLDAAVIKSLPTFMFGKGGEALECAVCLSEFEEKEKGRLLPKCKHCFHVECIDMWFHSHSTCPLCRSPVDAEDLPPEEEEAAPPLGEVVVELGELTLSQPAELTQVLGPSQGESSSSPSLGARRKGSELVGVSIEVPRRTQSFCFPGSSNSDESGPSRSPGHGFKSPTSRILSLKRILSREKRSPLPSPSSCCELDVESGRVDSPSLVLTPR